MTKHADADWQLGPLGYGRGDAAELARPTRVRRTAVIRARLVVRLAGIPQRALATELTKQLPGEAGLLKVPEAHLQLLDRRLKVVRRAMNPLPAAFEELDTENPHDLPDAWDPNLTVLAFTALQLKTGFVLDYVWNGDNHGGNPLLYARAEFEPPLRSVEEFEARFGVTVRGFAPTYPQAFLYAIEHADSALGLTELAVFLNEVPFFYLFWHALYDRVELVAHRVARDERLRGFEGERRDAVTRQQLGSTVRWVERQRSVDLLVYEHDGFAVRTWSFNPPQVTTASRQIARSSWQILY